MQSKWYQRLQSSLLTAAKPLIVIVGPTASGKTGLSIAMAKYLESQKRTAEIINADSRQFYQGLDIGTAKITEKEMQGVSHHLLSILKPNEECSIAWFLESAKKIIQEIHTRGNIPILVGGSMLYVSALIDGFEPIPVDPVLRKKLTEEYEKDDGASLQKRLAEVDPDSAAAIPRQNKVYLVRAMEIFESTGKPKSEQATHAKSEYDLLMFGTQVDSDKLKKRIELRTQKMLENGWIEEVKALMAQKYTKDDPAMESIGYREIIEFLQIPGAAIRKSPEVSALAELISKKTKHYAKRAMTWWRRDERILWIPMQPGAPIAQAD